MAEIVELAPGQDPPGSGQWIMVVSGSEYRDVEIKPHSLGTTYMAPASEEAATIDRAVDEAVRTGVACVYVRRSGDNSGAP
jgi:hypothetical protein